MVNSPEKSSILNWKLGLGLAATLFCASVGILVHDSMGLTSGASDFEIHEALNSRPQLFDLLGNPLQVKENDYAHVLIQGMYHARPGSTIAMLSPQNQVAVVDVSQAPLALLRGWSVEPLEHALDRIVHDKQQASMWMGDEGDLWFQTVICWMSAILFFGSILLYHEQFCDQAQAQQA